MSGVFGVVSKKDCTETLLYDTPAQRKALFILLDGRMS